MEQAQLNSKKKSKFRWLIGIVILLVLLGWLLNTPEGLLGKGDAVGYAVCHRIDLRSFHLGDRALPLCARCTGMYLGAVIGLGYQALLSKRKTGTPPISVLIPLIIMVALFAMDGGNSFFALLLNRGLIYQPNNILRLFTGTGMGLVIAAALFPAFNQTIWRSYQDEPAISSVRSFLMLIAAAVLIDILVLTENPLVLYPLALISAGGVVLVLTMLYTMVSTMILKQENKFDHWSQLPFVIMLGFGVGMAQIAFLDAARFWLTGTWEGFHFG